MTKVTRVTTWDVARAAGVSRWTVSRVLNGDRKVLPKTVRKVEATIEALGYDIGKPRSGPKTEKQLGIQTRTIAFLSTSGHSPKRMYQMPFFPLLLGGIQDALFSSELDMLLAHSPKARVVPAAFARKQADGVLLYGTNELSSRLKKILTGIPIVRIGRAGEDIFSEYDHVYFDNSSVGELAAAHLLRRGHRHLAFVDFSFSPAHTTVGSRREQFIRHATGAGADVEVLCPERAQTPEGQIRNIERIMRRTAALEPLPTGIFCPSDNAMLRAFNYLREHGIRPGYDVEMIGCNNDPAYMEQMRPRPATIDVKLDEVGENAVARLLERMGDQMDKSPTFTLVAPTVVPGEKV